MQCGDAAILRRVDVFGALQGLRIQVLGLIVMLRGAHRGGAVDQCRGPDFGSFQAHAQGQFDGTLHDPLVLFMPALGTVESHGFVENGEQSGLVAGVLRVDHGLFEVGCRLACRGMAGEYRIQSLQETVGVESRLSIGLCFIGCRFVCLRRNGMFRILIESCRELRQQCFLVNHGSSLSRIRRMLLSVYGRFGLVVSDDSFGLSFRTIARLNDCPPERVLT